MLRPRSSMMPWLTLMWPLTFRQPTLLMCLRLLHWCQKSNARCNVIDVFTDLLWDRVPFASWHESAGHLVLVFVILSLEETFHLPSCSIECEPSFVIRMCDRIVADACRYQPISNCCNCFIAWLEEVCHLFRCPELAIVWRCRIRYIHQILVAILQILLAETNTHRQPCVGWYSVSFNPSFQRF